MALLTYPRSEYLLSSSLESLHAQSIEWLASIQFWKDEMTFFYKLLHLNKSEKIFPTSELAESEKALVTLNANLDTLSGKIEAHERFLSGLLKTTVLQEEESYRQAHKLLFQEVYQLELDFKKFKKQLFQAVGSSN